MLLKRDFGCFVQCVLTTTLLVSCFEQAFASTSENQTQLLRFEINNDSDGIFLGQPFNSFTRKFTGSSLLQRQDEDLFVETSDLRSQDSFSFRYESNKASLALDNQVKASMPKASVQSNLSYEKKEEIHQLVIAKTHLVVLKTKSFAERWFREDLQLAVEDSEIMGTKNRNLLLSMKGSERRIDIKNKDGIRSFMQLTGTHFVNSLLYGFSCSQVLVFTFNDEKQKADFQNEIKGEAGAVDASLFLKIGALAEKKSIAVKRSFEMKLPENSLGLYSNMITELADILKSTNPSLSLEGSPKQEVENFNIIQNHLTKTFSTAIKNFSSEGSRLHLVGYTLLDYSTVSAETIEDMGTIGGIQAITDEVELMLQMKPTIPTPKKNKPKKASKT